MRTFLAAAAILAGFSWGIMQAVPADGATDQNPPIRTEWMPCGQEDDLNCVWDARHRGNGEGHSFFVSRTGRQWRLPHHIAHTLVTGEPRRDYVACDWPVAGDPTLCIWEERVWLNRYSNDWQIPAAIGRYLLSL